MPQQQARRHAPRGERRQMALPIARIDARTTEGYSQMTLPGRVMASLGQNCATRNPDGSCCGSCGYCRAYRIKSCNSSKLINAWNGIFEKAPSKLGASDFGYIYDFATPPLAPGTPGAIFTPNVSQVLIYTPQSITSQFALMELRTLATVADYPTVAGLPAGAFFIYLPYGTGINTAGVAPTVYGCPKFFALSNVSTANIAGFSTAYPTLADVPASRMNAHWQFNVLTTTAGSAVTFTKINMAVYDDSWMIQVTNFMSSTIIVPQPSTLLVTSVLPGGFWTLSQSTVASFAFVRSVYISHVSGAPERDRCGPCQTSRNQGCEGTRCGRHKAAFGFTTGAAFASDSGDQSLFVNHDNEVQMLTNVLATSTNKYHGLYLNEDRRIASGELGQNLSHHSRSELMAALELAKREHIAAEDPIVHCPYRYLDPRILANRSNSNATARMHLYERLTEKRAEETRLAQIAQQEAIAKQVAETSKNAREASQRVNGRSAARAARLRNPAAIAQIATTKSIGTGQSNHARSSNVPFDESLSAQSQVPLPVLASRDQTLAVDSVWDGDLTNGTSSPAPEVASSLDLDGNDASSSASSSDAQ